MTNDFVVLTFVVVLMVRWFVHIVNRQRSPLGVFRTAGDSPIAIATNDTSGVAVVDSKEYIDEDFSFQFSYNRKEQFIRHSDLWRYGYKIDEHEC